MKVSELIAELQKCPPAAPVIVLVSWEQQIQVAELSSEDADGRVVLGESLPAELYARDYKDDD